MKKAHFVDTRQRKSVRGDKKRRSHLPEMKGGATSARDASNGDLTPDRGVINAPSQSPRTFSPLETPGERKPRGKDDTTYSGSNTRAKRSKKKREKKSGQMMSALGFQPRRLDFLDRSRFPLAATHAASAHRPLVFRLICALLEPSLPHIPRYETAVVADRTSQ